MDVGGVGEVVAHERTGWLGQDGVKGHLLGDERLRLGFACLLFFLLVMME